MAENASRDACPVDVLPCMLHLAARVGTRSFGIGSAVLGLAHDQSTLGVRPAIWTCDAPGEALSLECAHGLIAGSIRTFPIVGPAALHWSFVLERQMEKDGGVYQIVHQHGIWTAVSRATERYRARWRRPTVIAPHGSLDHSALQRSTWKKRIALLLYEGSNLRQASCLHALSEAEATAIRSFGLQNPIAVIPNGVSERWLSSTGDPDAFRAKHGLGSGTRLLLFLGRITPIKGLPMLLRAMSRLGQTLAGWRLVIAGADEFGHLREIEALARRLALEPYVQYIGPQFGNDKRNAFAAADLFVLPSLSEAAPMAILEALGAGVPVLTTRASPWSDLVSHGCGWWTDVSEDAIESALRQALAKPSPTLHDMGMRGKRLVASKYTWRRAAEKTILLYEWLLGRAAQPSFVIRE